MERLTVKRNGVWHFEDWERGIDCTGKAVDRLAAYEDTGLEPDMVVKTAELAFFVHENGLDRIRDLLSSEKDGRLVALSEPMVSLMVSDDDNDSDVYCPKCDIETPMFYDANGAVKAWNRRAERTGRWVPVVNTWTQDEHEYGATWYKCDQCGRLCETKQPYCHCGAHMIEGEEHD